MVEVRKGQIWQWESILVTVKRVAKDGSWADIWADSGRDTWSKRQPLPLREDEGWKCVSE